MKTNVKTMQDLAATFPDIYREHKLLCHAQKKAGSVVITVIDEHNNSFQVTGGNIRREALSQLCHKGFILRISRK